MKTLIEECIADWRLRVFAVSLVLVGGMDDAVAGDWMQTGASLEVTATAFSLALVMAVIRSRK